MRFGRQCHDTGENGQRLSLLHIRSLHRGKLAQRRFIAKALPDADLRYFSKANAWASSENATYVLTVQGAYFDVWETSPALCFFNRDHKSAVTPT